MSQTNLSQSSLNLSADHGRNETERIFWYEYNIIIEVLRNFTWSTWMLSPLSEIPITIVISGSTLGSWSDVINWVKFLQADYLQVYISSRSNENVQYIYCSSTVKPRNIYYSLSIISFTLFISRGNIWNVIVSWWVSELLNTWQASPYWPHEQVFVHLQRQRSARALLDGFVGSDVAVSGESSPGHGFRLSLTSSITRGYPTAHSINDGRVICCSLGSGYMSCQYWRAKLGCLSSTPVAVLAGIDITRPNQRYGLTSSSNSSILRYVIIISRGPIATWRAQLAGWAEETSRCREMTSSA